jgi:hypothetical protein
MYHTVEEVLEDVYSIKGERIEPINGTALVCAWCESKGVMGGGGDLTQAEKHAHAEMIISKIERVLNRYELAVVKCKHSADLSGIVDITAYIEEQNNGVNLLLCDAILSNLFTERPKKTAIMDKYDVSNGHVYRQFEKVRKILAAIETTAYLKLYDEFKQCGIIS